MSSDLPSRPDRPADRHDDSTAHGAAGGAAVQGKPSRLRGFVWPAVCVFQLGLLAGATAWWLNSQGLTGSSHETPAPAEMIGGEAGKGPEALALSPPDVDSEITKGDDVLREGRYE